MNAAAPEPPEDLPPPPAHAAPDDAIDRAAAVDDVLGGFAPEADPSAPPAGLHRDPVAEAAEPQFAGLIDTMLLLRQTAAAERPTPAGPLPTPPSIGRYTILRLAGAGGFATVWEGFDTVLRRPVAVKVRRDEMLLSESARRRFVREAEIAARLVHPHIVTIFEVGEERGREFIAAEFCSGGSLAAWLERHPGPRPPREAARLVHALATAAAHAHAAGVIHRDIKPANVLLVPAGAGTEPLLEASPPAAADRSESADRGYTVKLGDFGLGKLGDDDSAGDALTQLTRSGATIGTPAWMAPEQIDRSFGGIGPTTDVHGLGLVLHRLLTGRAARDAVTDAETYRQILLEEPVSADRLCMGVPRDLSAVAGRCLAKRAVDRYATAADLAADLDRWLAGRPTVARPISTAGRGLRWVRRRPLVATLAVAVGIASVAATWAGLDRARQAVRVAERDEAIRRQQGISELRRGFEALRTGNAVTALAQREAARAIDPTVADSVVGRWLARRTHGERALLLVADRESADSPRDLYDLALTADGATAAVAGADGGVRLLRGLDRLTGVAAGPTVGTTAAHDEVNGVAFSADGGRLATAGQDGRLRWWDVTEAGLVAAGAATFGDDALYAVAFTPDGRGIASGGEDRVVRLVPLDTPDRPTVLFEFEPPPGKSPEIESLVFVDDDLLAAACGDTVVLLDVSTGRLVRECQRAVEGNRNAVHGSLAVSPDGRRLMACGTDMTAHVWDVATGGLVLSLPPHPGWVQGCSFAPDGGRIATACRDGGVRIFDAETGRLVNRLIGHEGRVWSVTYEPQGTLLTTGADGTVRRWDPATTFDTAGLRLIPMPDGAIARVWAAPAATGFDPGGYGDANSRLVIGYGTTGSVWEVNVDHDDHRLLARGAEVFGWQTSLDPHGGRIAVRRADPPGVDVIPLPGAAASPTMLPLPEEIRAIDLQCCWLTDGGIVVRTDDGGFFWSPAVGLGRAEGLRRIGTVPGDMHALAAAPAGPVRVASVGSVALIHALPRSPRATVFPAPPLELPITSETTAVGWSPDAAVLAVGTRTGLVELFDATTGRSRGAVVPHERRIVALVFSDDGRTLFTADRDTVRISDVGSLTTFDEVRPGIDVQAMCLTRDGGCLVISGQAAASEQGVTAPLAVIDLSGH
jgi:WD40 repeat protein